MDGGSSSVGRALASAAGGSAGVTLTVCNSGEKVGSSCAGPKEDASRAAFCGSSSLGAGPRLKLLNGDEKAYRVLNEDAMYQGRHLSRLRGVVLISD